MNYIRLSKNYNDNLLLPKTEDIYNKIDNVSPWFTSMFEYNENHYEKWKNSKSLAGITDNKTKNLWWDFDSKDLELSKKDTLEVVKRLIKHGLNQNEIQVAFSGNKGFSIVVETDVDRTAKQVKSIAFDFALGLETFDKEMYDNQRIFRILFSRNEKSKLFKIPLTIKELETLSIDEIKQEAKSINQFNKNEVLNFYKKTNKDFTVKVVEEKKEKINTVTQEILDFKEKPSNWRNCKWSLLQGRFKNGERHNALMVLAATCRALKYDKNTAYYICKSAIDKQAALTSDDKFPKTDLYTRIVGNIYSDKWNGGQYSCKEDGWLREYCLSLGKNSCEHSRDRDETPIVMSEVDSSFTSFAKDIEHNTIKTGLREIDETLLLTTGMLFGVVGAPGSGKTTLALELAENSSKQGSLVVFASLDMHRNRLFEKLIHRVTNGNYSRKEIYEMYRNGKGEHLTKLVQERYSNVFIYDRSSPTVDDLREYILKVEDKTGKKVKVLLLDYFERVNSDKNEDTAASKDVGSKLQDLINDLNILGIILLQPNKMSLGGGPDKPILSYTAIKGSSFIYQSLRAIMSIWRPMYTPETKQDDHFIQMALLKNDLGELGTFNYGWRGKSGEIYELPDEGHDELERLLKEKENKGNEDKGLKGWG